MKYESHYQKPNRTFMRRACCALLLLLSLAHVVAGQTRTFSRDTVEFTLELPSPAWRVVSRLDVHDHVEFIYGKNEESGYLRLRKSVVDAGTTAAELFSYDEKWHLRSLSGYVICGECKGEKFEGQLSGLAFSYEYTSGGKPMAGRLYYLEVDNRIFYTLHFTGERDKLKEIRAQVDSIARSFRLK